MLTDQPRADNTEQWKKKMTEGQRICFEKRAGTVLHALGYPTLPGKASGGYLAELNSLRRSAFLAIRRRIRGA
jgi:hypothetical protein